MAAILAIGGVLLTLWGCPPPRQLDWNSGGDETRDHARKLFVGQNVTDSVDDSNGDNTDWKLIRIREPGDLDITVAMDNTRQMNGYVSIKDGFGIELGRRAINSSENLYTFSGLPVFQGEIFVQVFVDRGRSPYTAGVAFRPTETGTAVGPRLIEVPVRDTKGGKGRRVGGDGLPPDDPKDPLPDTTPDTTPEVEDPGVAITLRGRIERIVELEGGGSQLIIVGFGSADGVRAGMRGQIVGLGAGFRVTRVGRKSAVGVTSAKAESLGPYKTVVVRVKAAE
jgi:hypothetical protein